MNNLPLVRLKLRIDASGFEPYEIEKRVAVPHTALGALSNGRPLSVYVDREDREGVTIDWGAAVSPMTVSEKGASVALGDDPAVAQDVLKVLEAHGTGAAGEVDLRQNPAARQAVVEALIEHGVDVAHAAALDPTASDDAPTRDEEPLARLTKLMQLKNAQLISDEEFAHHKQRILDEV